MNYIEKYNFCYNLILWQEYAIKILPLDQIWNQKNKNYDSKWILKTFFISKFSKESKEIFEYNVKDNWF
jgi:hypothetical protein